MAFTRQGEDAHLMVSRTGGEKAAVCIVMPTAVSIVPEAQMDGVFMGQSMKAA